MDSHSISGAGCRLLGLDDMGTVPPSSLRILVARPYDQGGCDGHSRRTRGRSGECRRSRGGSFVGSSSRRCPDRPSGAPASARSPSNGWPRARERLPQDDRTVGPPPRCAVRSRPLRRNGARPFATVLRNHSSGGPRPRDGLARPRTRCSSLTKVSTVFASEGARDRKCERVGDCKIGIDVRSGTPRRDISIRLPPSGTSRSRGLRAGRLGS